MIKVRIPPENEEANLKTYVEPEKSFSWIEVEREFTWHETGELNIVQEALDRWARSRDERARKALIFEKAGKTLEFTYQELRELSSQWANLLIEYGLTVGDRVFIFLPSCPEIYFLMLACARLGIIFSPLFPDLPFHELEFRLQNARPRAIVTHPDLIERLPDHAMSGVERIFLTEGAGVGLFPSELPVKDIIGTLPKKSAIRWVRGTTPLYLLYTSGSAGPPKGVVHAHMDMLGHFVTARHVLNIKERTIVWTDGGPGWVTGTVYGAFAPWLCGATSVIQGDEFSASTWYRTLERHKVEIWYTTPSTLERLAEAGDDLPGRYHFSRLRHIATAGEPLRPDQFNWTRETLKRSPHDTWWMTETGMICIANYPSMSIKPGSMGKPVPGIEASVLDENGEPLPVMTLGELALRTDWPALMTGIWQDAARYQDYFRFRNWFLTGDMVVIDEDGYFFHYGRNDDLIKVGETFVGPYEIEQVLALHPAVAEAAVIAVGSSSAKTYVKAFVTVCEGFTASANLNHKIKAFVKANISQHLPLAKIEFMEELPKTRSGKLLRRVLRAREKGLPSGDPTKLKE
jgi:acetyl-CoA synthetase